MNNEILVIGHKNPDTDSICSAIAYSYLENNVDDAHVYIPKRAGQLNEETRFVLNRFKIQPPECISDVRTQVCDIEIKKTKGVSRTLSLKSAWTLMNDLSVVTLPVIKNGRLEGVITTEDIAKSYMNVYDSSILSTAHTKFQNIVETLGGKIVVGDAASYYTAGKVLIAAANPDVMESYIEKDDLVILGNRYESQLCAIEMKAACIVVCDGAEISRTIIKLAQDNECTIISSPYDTYTVARLINQSMPIGYFMSSKNIVTFKTSDFIDDIKNVMAKLRYRDFPIVDEKGKYIGMISRRNLLGASKKKIILVDHNEKNQAVDGAESAELLGIIDHHRLGTIETITPVFFRNQPLGCTATIIYQMFNEKGIPIPGNIAGILCSAILSDTLMYRSPTCTEVDRLAAEHLAEIAGINTEEYSREIFNAGSNLKSKTEEEIFRQDFKKFSVEGVTFGVGQINSMSSKELTDIKNRLQPYIIENFSSHGLDLVFFMLTNIATKSTELLFAGNGAKDLLEEAYSGKVDGPTLNLRGVVSRKKQFLPGIMNAIQQ